MARGICVDLNNLSATWHMFTPMCHVNYISAMWHACLLNKPMYVGYLIKTYFVI
jgi:hypothetical protein